MDILFLTGVLMRELTHTVLSDVAGRFGGWLYDVSVREDKIVLGGPRGAALFKLIY